jgi:hypothetical protein
MNFIKLYFLYFLMCSSVVLFAMDIEVENVRDKIDSELLGINKNSCCKRLLGTLFSLSMSCGLSKEKAFTEMQKIELYITSDDKETVLEQLEKRHWYIYYVLNGLIDIKVREIQNVTGSTVDALLNLPTENGLQRLVHKRALQKYFDDAGIDKPLAHLFLNKESDIHCTALCEHTCPIKQDMLAISEDSTYLLSTDNAGKEKIWDLRQAERVSLQESERQAIQWKFGKWQKSTSIFGYYSPLHDAVDKNDQYYATEGNPLGEQYPVLLWKRPTEKSYLCHEALLNSSKKPNEVEALLQSKSFTAIEGFPKTNLAKKINAILSKEPVK